MEQRLTDVGELSAEAVQHRYRDSKALVVPSVLESFGLPLIEAGRIDLRFWIPTYVGDLVDPEETFDPNSPRSIAHAAIRFLHLPQRWFAFMNAADFLDRIIEERLEDRSSPWRCSPPRPQPLVGRENFARAQIHGYR